MSRIAYVNGSYVPQSQASVNVEDRGYQFADGIYEVVHVYRGRFTDWDLHFARLERSLNEVRIKLPMSRAALERVLHEVASRNRIENGLIYMQVTRGVATRNHAFPATGTPPSLVVTARRVGPYPANVDAWTTSVVSHPDERWARCDIKSVGLLPNVLARQAAKEKGASEAILVDADGMVTEGAATSFWIVDAQGVLRCPPLTHAILPGCTRAALLAEMAAHGIPVDTEAFSLDDARQAQEAFITSATSFVKPVIAIDGHPVAEGHVGPITRRLFALFARHVQGGLANAAE
jgi:D-alanine transaminase